MIRTEHARLLYVLLDAAADEGRLRDPAMALKWQVVSRRFDEATGEQEAVLMQSLLEELDRRDALAGTWIKTRWHAAKARLAGQVARRLEPWCNLRSRSVDP